jgi:protein-tyrosine kinase
LRAAAEEYNLSTIQQAAKRLEQLKQAGVEIDSSVVERDSLAEAQKAEAVPLRIAKELDARGPAVAVTGSRGEQVAAPAKAPARHSEPAVARTGRSPFVEIDLARLAVEGYITPDLPRSRVAEEFRVIKRPLLNNANGKSTPLVRNANRIMVTSSLPGEGKTFTALNLAMSLAMDIDTHVLLVDADASRPAVLDRLGLAGSKGLLDLLAEPELPLGSVVLSTNVERLSILPAGTPQGKATELLASEAMNRLVERLASDDPRRIVLFDTPPLLVASEARVLAEHMGQVVLVIAADDTPQGTVSEALSALEKCPVVFTLLNRVSPSDRGSYYGTYGAYTH